MAINVNQEKCIGCGRCTEVCSGTFKLNESGKSIVISQDDKDCAMRAADQCPVEAITVDEE